MDKKFIQKALKDSTKGKLRRELEIPKGRNIPFKLLDKIIDAEPGDTMKNPTEIGKRRIKVTERLEDRASFARVLKRFSQNR